MVDTRGTRRNQAGDIPRDSVIFDALVLLQFNGTLYKAIAEQKITSRQSCEVLICFTFHSPTSIVAVRGDSMAFDNILQFGVVRKRHKRRYLDVSHLFRGNTVHTNRSESASKIAKKRFD